MDPAITSVDLIGSSGPVDVRVTRMPVRTDPPAGFRYPYPDFGADFLPELHRMLRHSRQTGPPWRRQPMCGRCGTRLEGEPGTRSLTITLRLERVPPFEIALRLPGWQCTSCNGASIPSERELEFHVAEALVQAMKAGRVRPG